MSVCGRTVGGVIIACRNIRAPIKGNSRLPMCWQKFSAAASPDGFIRRWWLKKLAVSAGAYSDSSRLDNGEFVIYATPAPQTDFAVLAQAIEAEIDALKNLMASDDEMRRAKRQLAADLIFARDSQQSMANIFGSAAMLGLSPDEVLGWVDEIEQVTAQDVCAKRHKIY